MQIENDKHYYKVKLFFTRTNKFLNHLDGVHFRLSIEMRQETRWTKPQELFQHF